MLSHNNLYDPIMYLINKQIKRHFNVVNGGHTGEGGLGKEYLEPIKLVRDQRGRLSSVEGWEYIDYFLDYRQDGLLDFVDVIHRITGKQLRISLKYDDKFMLTEVIPEILEEGEGDAGKIDVPNVIEDY